MGIGVVLMGTRLDNGPRRADGQRWPRVAPTFCFSSSSMVSCEHPRSCSVCPTIFETLTDSMPLLHGYSSRSTIALQCDIYVLSAHQPRGPGGRRRGREERENLRKIFSSCENGASHWPPREKQGKMEKVSKINECHCRKD